MTTLATTQALALDPVVVGALAMDPMVGVALVAIGLAPIDLQATPQMPSKANVMP